MNKALFCILALLTASIINSKQEYHVILEERVVILEEQIAQANEYCELLSRLKDQAGIPFHVMPIEHIAPLDPELLMSLPPEVGYVLAEVMSNEIAGHVSSLELAALYIRGILPATAQP